MTRHTVVIAMTALVAGCAQAGSSRSGPVEPLDVAGLARAAAARESLDQRRPAAELARDHADVARAGQPGAFVAGALLGPIGLGLAWAVAGDGTPNPEERDVAAVLEAQGDVAARDYARAYRDRVASRRRASAIGYALAGWATTTAVVTVYVLSARATAQNATPHLYLTLKPE